MSLQHIQEHFALAQQYLSHLLEEEQKMRAEGQGRPILWKFVYEQLMDDGKWHPIEQTIEAYDIAGAFGSLGFVVQKLSLTIRNIRYGTYDEMQEEDERVRRYWAGTKIRKSASEDIDFLRKYTVELLERIEELEEKLSSWKDSAYSAWGE